MIKVALIEDNQQYKDALILYLNLDNELEITHVLSDCNSLGANFSAAVPDVILMDIDLPGKSGIDGVFIIKNHWPETKVLMLTQFEDSDKIFAAIRAGANGYLLKKDSPSAIKTAIIAAMQNESPINGIIANKVLAYFHKQQSVNIDTQTLTTRESEILQLIVKGFSYKEIAAQCHISTHTLNTHIKNIYQKLNIHSRAEIAARFLGSKL